MKPRAMRSGRSAVVASCFGLVLVGMSTCLDAAEAYAVRFTAGGPEIDASTGSTWVDRLVFHNMSDLPQTVKLLGVSNGSKRLDAKDLEIGPGRSFSVRSD